MAERNPQFLQIGLGHIRQDIEIDGIFGEDRRVLREPEPVKPSRYPVVDTHRRMLFSRTMVHYHIFLFSLTGFPRA